MLARSLKTPEISLDTVLYYMRAGQDKSAAHVAQEGIRLVREAADCKFVCRSMPLDLGECVKIGDWEIQSKSLKKHLAGCKEVVLLGASAGLGVDRVITACGKKSGVLALAADSAGGVLVEAVCDEAERYVGKAHPFRYSPGYGDFALEEQRKLCELLQLQKTIGVTLTEGLMLRPTKSVTAIIGIL